MWEGVAIGKGQIGFPPVPAEGDDTWPELGRFALHVPRLF